MKPLFSERRKAVVAISEYQGETVAILAGERNGYCEAAHWRS